MNFNMTFKKKIFFSVFLTIAIVFSCIYFGFFLGINDIKGKDEELELQARALKEKYKEEEKIRKNNYKLREKKDKVETLNKGFINPKEVLKFITSLEDIATNNNINQEMNLSEMEVENNVYQKKNINIITKGMASDQLNYLKELENLNYYLNIKSLEIIISSAPVNPEVNKNKKEVSTSTKIINNEIKFGNVTIGDQAIEDMVDDMVIRSIVIEGSNIKNIEFENDFVFDERSMEMRILADTYWY